MDPRRQQHQSNVIQERTTSSRWGSKRSINLLIILLVIGSIIGIFYAGYGVVASLTSDSAVKSKQFQAVFLSNGQVYFGKISNVSNNTVVLKDIFYLQVNNNSTNGSSTNVQSGSTAAGSQQVSLAKLGSELHGPDDVMYINRSQVLFWENLKNSGKVVDAINKYQNTKH
jgi:hypothetical protein